VERNNGARCSRAIGEAAKQIHPYSLTLTENGYNCGFSLRAKMAGMEVL